MGGGLAIESRAILVTRQYLQGKKKSNFKNFLNVIENACLRYFKCGEQTVIAKKNILKQMIAI